MQAEQENPNKGLLMNIKKVLKDRSKTDKSKNAQSDKKPPDKKKKT